MQIDLHHLRREVAKTHMSPSWFHVLVLDETSSENKPKKLEMFQKREISRTFIENHQRNDPKKTTIPPDEIHFNLKNMNIL